MRIEALITNGFKFAGFYNFQGLKPIVVVAGVDGARKLALGISRIIGQTMLFVIVVDPHFLIVF